MAEGLNKAWGIVQWYPAKKMITASRSKGVSYETIETLEFRSTTSEHTICRWCPVNCKRAFIDVRVPGGSRRPVGVAACGVQRERVVAVGLRCRGGSRLRVVLRGERIRVVLKLDGELIVDCDPVIGYLHRGTEKLGEHHRYAQIIPWTDRTDYVAAPMNNLGCVLAFEKLCGITAPERAQYWRVIMSELARIASLVRRDRDDTPVG